MKIKTAWHYIKSGSCGGKYRKYRDIIDEEIERYALQDEVLQILNEKRVNVGFIKMSRDYNAYLHISEPTYYKGLFITEEEFNKLKEQFK